MDGRAERTWHAPKDDVNDARFSPRSRTSDVDMSKRNETHQEEEYKYELWSKSQDFKSCATHSQVCASCHESFLVSSMDICRTIRKDIDKILHLGPLIQLGSSMLYMLVEQDRYTIRLWNKNQNCIGDYLFLQSTPQKMIGIIGTGMSIERMDTQA